LRTLGRGRAVPLIAAAICVIALVGVGLRYLWLRDERRSAEHSVAMLVRQSVKARALLREVRETRVTVDENVALVEAHRARLQAEVAMLRADLARARAGTTAAQITAYLTVAQANNLRACLTGVSQALNQLSVGDGRALDSLLAVDRPCRAAGVQ
jgi:hypothetical protein